MLRILRLKQKNGFLIKKTCTYLHTEENIIDNKASVLDSEISNTNQIQVLYDKRDTFPFSIFRNIPISMFCSSIGGAIIGNYTTFFKSAQPLVTRIQNQGAAKYMIENFKNIFMIFCSYF